MGGAVSNVSKGISNLSKGKNIGGSLMSVATGGLIGTPEEPGVPSLSDRMRDLEAQGIFGTGRTAAQAQDSALADITKGKGVMGTGLGTIGEAADYTRQVLRGEAPSVAQLQFQKNLNDIIAAQASAAQSNPVDAALAFRMAQDSADKVRQQALIDQALLRASEVAQARGELGNLGVSQANIGRSFADIGQNQYGTNLAAITGQQAQAAQQAFDAAQGQYGRDAGFADKILGAGASIASAGVGSGMFGGGASGNKAGTSGNKAGTIDAGSAK